MKKDVKVLLIAFLVCCPILFFPWTVLSDNNIEFLDKDMISDLNFGIYEVVTPKLENDKVTYARELPFDTLDFIERNEKYYSIGTAFFINDKELMTAAHVFRLMYYSIFQDFYIRDASGNVYPVNKVIKYSTLRDMAQFDLKKYPDEIKPLTFDGDVEVGDTVFSVGNAQGEGIAYRAGQVASFTPEREFGKWKNIRFTSPASPGNSGGPLLNLQGQVVGLIVQKNKSENYNIAIPIDETKNLKNTAEFHIRNVKAGIYGVDDTLTRDWSFNLQLPASVEEVAEKAQDSLNNHWLSLSTELTEKVKEKNLPEGKRFRSYLRKQPIIKGLAPLVPGTNFAKWRADSSYSEKLPITESQNVYRSRGAHSDLHVIVEKPADVSLKEFLESPKMVMDNMLKAVTFSREVGSESVAVTSFGEPDKKTIIEDKLGRSWISSLWSLRYYDYFTHTSCLPYPKGVICSVDTRPNSNLKYGFFENMYESYNEIAIGYDGKIDDWVEYFSLDEKYLPEIFKKSKITFIDGKLNVELKDFAIAIENEKIEADSVLHFHMGYSNEELLAEDLVLFEIFPVKGAKPQYRVQPFYKPGVFSSDKYRSTWNSVFNGTGEYSGELINQGETKVIKKAISATDKKITSYNGEKIDKIFVAGCTYQSTEQDVETDCEKFIQSIQLK